MTKNVFKCLLVIITMFCTITTTHKKMIKMTVRFLLLVNLAFYLVMCISGVQTIINRSSRCSFFLFFYFFFNPLRPINEMFERHFAPLSQTKFSYRFLPSNSIIVLVWQLSSMTLFIKHALLASHDAAFTCTN